MKSVATIASNIKIGMAATSNNPVESVILALAIDCAAVKIGKSATNVKNNTAMMIKPPTLICAFSSFKKLFTS